MIEETDTIEALAALAHPARLGLYRRLVQAGREGLAAGAIAEALGISPSALSFHLARLRHAGLLRARRRGRHIVYAADFERMSALLGYLTERCCSDSAAGCGPECEHPAAPAPRAGARRRRLAAGN